MTKASKYLLDDEKPIDKRLDYFIDKIDELGYKTEAISMGTLDDYIISKALNIPPQVVSTYFELYLLNDGELELIKEKNLDMGIIRTLMLIDPSRRNLIYANLDEILESDYPVSEIVDFLNEEEWRMSIEELYESVSSSYWKKIASYLKDSDINKGPINKNFRGMVFKIGKYKASPKQLNWLEKAIFYDEDQSLGVFRAKTFQENYPEDVKKIEKFLEDYNKLRKDKNRE